MSIGQRLKELREAAGYNKKELADKLEMPYTTYNNYETDMRDVGSETLKKLSKFYNVSIDYILENQTDLDFLSKDVELRTIAAHHDGEDWTEEELDEVERFKEWVRSKRR